MQKSNNQDSPEKNYKANRDAEYYFRQKFGLPIILSVGFESFVNI